VSAKHLTVHVSLPYVKVDKNPERYSEWHNRRAEFSSESWST